MLKYLILLFALAGPSLAYAETSYIANTRLALIHAGPDDEEQIVYKLSEGTPVEIIQKDADTNFVLVRTEKGEKGWIEQQYLQDEPNTVDSSHVMQAIQKLTTQLQTLKNKLADDELKLAAIPENMAISNNNAQTITSNSTHDTGQDAQLHQELNILKVENIKLRNAVSFRWFLSGTAVLLIGMLLGLVIAKLQNHRRRLFD